MRRPSRIALALGLFSFVLAIPPAVLLADTLSAAPPDQLGKVNFPTSCTAEVQPTIEKGVALLHSFQYTESEKTFAEEIGRASCRERVWRSGGTVTVNGTDRH